MQAILPDELKMINGLMPDNMDHLKVWGQGEFEPEAEYGLALGFFDGVHKGHRALIDRLLWSCKQEQLHAAVYTFDYLPKTKTSPVNASVLRIQPPEDRAAYLLSRGVKLVFEQAFTEAVMALSPDAFVDLLCKRFKIRYIVVGDDFRFGYKRRGTVRDLERLGAARGIRVEIVPQVTGYGEAISSSRIRELLSSGQLGEANRLLGHPFMIRGNVVRGRGLARTWGMPTCNMHLNPEQLVLPYGVYASRTRIGNRYYNSISNIGLRPTLNTLEKEPLLETYLFDMDQDLYGQTLEVFILEFQRAESYFANLEDMVVVMRGDIERTKNYHASAERLTPIGEAAAIPYHHLPSTRYTQAYLHFCLSLPQHPRKNSARALAMRIVLQASAAYPTRQAFSLAQDRLYGASLDAYNDSEGSRQTFEFTAEGIVKGLHGEAPFQEVVSMLLDALKFPLLDEQGLFDEQLFNMERSNLAIELKSRIQNKAKYAYDRSLSLLLENKDEGISPKGDLALIDSLTREEVSEAWFELLREGKAELYAAGNLDSSFHNRLLEELAAFTVLGRPAESTGFELNFPNQLDFEKGKTFTEFKDVEQTRLVIYWGGLPPYPLIRGAVLNVLNSLLGGDTHSLLFEVVREAHGLAYSIHSQALKHLSMIMVAAGITAGQSELAINDCREQLANIVAAKFSERHFKSSLAMVEAKLMALSDSLNGQLVYQMSALEVGHLQDSKEALEYLHGVTINDVSAMAGELEELFVYQLMPASNTEAEVEK